jgi:hypothetical protein
MLLELYYYTIFFYANVTILIYTIEIVIVVVPFICRKNFKRNKLHFVYNFAKSIAYFF